MVKNQKLTDAPVWLMVVSVVELLTRPTTDTTDSEIKKNSDVPLSLLRNLEPEDIKYDLQANPVIRDQVLDLHKMAKSSGLYDGIANISLGLVLVLLFVGLVVGSQGGVIGTVDAIAPALGQVIYASILPVLVGIIASWKSQSILSDQLYPKIIEMLSDPNSDLSRAVEARRAFIYGREAAITNAPLAAKVAPYVADAAAITPARNRKSVKSKHMADEAPLSRLNGDGDVKPTKKSRKKT